MRTWLRRFGFTAPFLVLASALAFVAIDARGGELAAAFNVTPQRGELAAASITGNSTGTANTVLTTTKPTVQIAIENTCGVELMVVRVTGTAAAADFKRIPANSFRVLDLKTNAAQIAITTWKVYATGAAPASCNFEIVSLPPS